jgi:hypothetical protein
MSWSHVDWCKFCVYLGGMNIRDFGTIKATGLKWRLSSHLQRQDIPTEFRTNLLIGEELCLTNAYSFKVEISPQMESPRGQRVKSSDTTEYPVVLKLALRLPPATQRYVTSKTGRPNSLGDNILLSVSVWNRSMLVLCEQADLISMASEMEAVKLIAVWKCRDESISWLHFNRFSLLSKNESRLIKSPLCMSVCVFVCPPLITFKPLGRFSWNLVLR